MATDETTAAAQAAKTAAEKQTREQSSIAFPYGDLDDGISVARALLACGGVPCEPDQLAGAMGQTPSSGNFRMKIAAARMFGVIETVSGKYQLTELGFAITDPQRQKAARADAFLNVPLYRKVYDTYRNNQLPPRPIALERAFVGFGVAQKQADRARHAFDRSAQQAGYFEHGNRDRLIRPAVASSAAPSANGGEAPHSDPPPPPPPPRDPALGSNGGGGSGGRHPFIEGLLATLPAVGTVWTIEGRAAWLEAAASAFKLLYQGDGRIKIAAEAEAAQNKGGAPA
jgi:hypothetical protein